MAEADKPTVVDPRWDEIRTSLNEKIDFSNPQINRDVVMKFVAKIVPNGKNHFRWYMNLDGNESTAMDLVTGGRKNNPVVMFAGEEDKPPLHNGDVIGVSELMKIKSNKKIPIHTQMSSLVSMQHRQLLRDKGNLPQKTDNFSLKLVDMCLTKDFAFDYIKTKSMVDHFKLSKWQNMNIGVYI